VAVICAALLPGDVRADGEDDGRDSGETLTLAVFGDWPYSLDLLAAAPLLLHSINSDPDVALVLHVGDIHSGSFPCSAAWNQGIFDIFEQFEDPFVYTPGDNEWCDCQKAKEGSSGAPLAELAGIRSLFFPNPGHTLGINSKRVLSQAEVIGWLHKPDAQFVENVVWEQAQVVFVTINQPGSNNDTLPWNGVFSDPPAQAEEVAERTAADIHWLELAFLLAQATKAKGLVIGTQADMWDPAQAAPGGDGLSAYTVVVQEIADLCLRFRRPVLLFNGDSHVYGTDRPLADPTSATGLIHGTPAVPNLTRITVMGSTATKEWIKLTVNPNSPAVFSWERIFYLP
jgi:hypothetical protein